ncbi:MAG: hypothetical protein K2L41_10610, partial [Muribaculaceae bacterium]|nr:hypothetical protein [Muribaculaceae bacterium]
LSIIQIYGKVTLYVNRFQYAIADGCTHKTLCGHIIPRLPHGILDTLAISKCTRVQGIPNEKFSLKYVEHTLMFASFEN